MEIKGKVFCLFEQSGTFKKAFMQKGIDAIDIDIQNEFQQTDIVLDLFNEIEKAYENLGKTIFDDMTPDDLIFAFFPCTYFSGNNGMFFTGDALQYKKLTFTEKIDAILLRNEARNTYYVLLVKLVGIAARKQLRLIIENPYGKCSYLMHNFILYPGFLDTNRSLHGDKFIKPTMYYHLNCTLGSWKTWVFPKEITKVRKASPSRKKGLCSTDRSMISEDYSRRFVEEIILGKKEVIIQLTMNL